MLNLATDDETFTNLENSFIDKVSQQLELNRKVSRNKKTKTASIKLVDFGKKAGESFCITKDMDKQKKLKLLEKSTVDGML